MKTILITIALLATVGIIIFSYAVEAVNVDFDSKGNIIEKDSLFQINLGDLGDDSRASITPDDGRP